MKIGFDAKRALSNRTGLGNYSRYILNGLLQYAPDVKLELFAPKPLKKEADCLLPASDRISIHYPERQMDRKFRSYWRTFSMVRDLQKVNIDLYHGLSNELPWNIRNSGIPSVVTIHDLIYRLFPKYYNPIDRLLYHWKYKRSCEIADCIVAVSECTKRDLVRLYGIEPNKIQVIYQGCDDRFREPVSFDQMAQVKEKYELPETYIIGVGSIEERKNMALLVEVLPQLEDSLNLVLVGKRTPYVDYILARAEKFNVKHRIRILNGVPHADLPALYKGAKVFVYPSRYEGFGIPVLEALCVGVPVVAATGSCLEEAGGDAAIYISPDDSKACAEAIMQVLENPVLAQEMISRGRQWSECFSLDGQTQKMEMLYQRLISSNKM